MMQEIARVNTHSCERVFYTDGEGVLIEKLVHDSAVNAPILNENQQLAGDYRGHGKSPFRLVARVPDNIYLKWLMEDGVPGYADAETADYVAKKHLSDPANKYLLTVPTSYRMMRNG